MELKAHDHPAYPALKKLAQESQMLSQQLTDRLQFGLGLRDPQEAAVLILFGPLKEEQGPAQEKLQQGADTDLDLLIVVRARTLRQHAGQPAFPGGKIDGEDYRTAAKTGQPVAYVAALREAVEETGLDPSGVEILGSLKRLPLLASNFMVTPVLAWWSKNSAVAVQDQQESSQVLRVPVAELLDPAHRHLVEITRKNRNRNSVAFTLGPPEKPVVIWGFTATILDLLFQHLGWEKPWNKQDIRKLPDW